MSINARARLEEACARIQDSIGQDRLETLLVGTDLADLREPLGAHLGLPIRLAKTLVEGHEVLGSLDDDSPRVLLVVSTACCGDPLGPRLRHLVEPIEGMLLPDVRTVVRGAAELTDFSLIQDLLAAHVVDWLPPGIEGSLAVARILAAREKTSLRIALLGMGLRSSAPRHTLTHITTRLVQLMEPMGLDHLHIAPAFLAAFTSEAPGQDDGKLGDLLRAIMARHRQEPELWQRAYGITESDLESLGQRHNRDLLLRCWAAYLADVLAGVAATDRGDRRELQQFLEDIGRDLFPQGENHD